MATLLKPPYLSLLHEPVRRVVPSLAGARGLTAPLRRYTSNGRLRHPIWLGPADSPQSGQEPALASGRGARACRGVRAMVWVCQQLGAQETSATALSNLPVVGARWAALASELTAGPSAPGLKEISRQAARSAEVWSKLAGTVGSPQIGSRSATRPCCTGPTPRAVELHLGGISAGLRGKSPRRSPHEGDFRLWSSKISQWVGLHPWARSSRCSSPLCSNLFSYRPLLFPVRKWHKSCRQFLRAMQRLFLRDVARQRNVVARRCRCNSDRVE